MRIDLELGLVAHKRRKTWWWKKTVASKGVGQGKTWVHYKSYLVTRRKGPWTPRTEDFLLHDAIL